jgi:CTP synthase (UTP-ammonia lyase)
VVGKYTGLKDAYKSLIEALTHGGLANNVAVDIDWIESEVFERDAPRSPSGWRGCTGCWCPARSGSGARRG